MLTTLPQYLAYARKAIIQVTGLVGSLLSLGLLPGNVAPVVTTIFGILTTISHFMIPNAPKPGTVPATEDFEALSADENEEQPAEWKPSAVVTASQIATLHENARPPSE